MQCTARLIRALLGAGSIADKKLAFGCSGLEILGVDMELSQIGFQCRPSQQKVVAWCNQIQEALTAGFLAPGAASKLAGRLSWGAGALFRRLGRAMLRPVFDQKTRRDGKISPELAAALQWWLQVLKSGLAELKEWRAPPQQPLHLF